MAWTAPMTAVANAAFTAAQFNTHVRDNLNETAPAKATTGGRLLVTTGLNSIAERVISESSVLTNESTSTTTFTNLATTGPSVTATTGTLALVAMTALMNSDTAGESGAIAYEVSGASSVSTTDTRALRLTSVNAGDIQGATSLHLQSLTAGSNTFTLKYRAVTTGTVTFQQRRLIVIAL